MKPGTTFTLVAEIALTLTATTELIGTNLDQATRTLEEAISLVLLQLIGNGMVDVKHFELHPIG